MILRRVVYLKIRITLQPLMQSCYSAVLPRGGAVASCLKQRPRSSDPFAVPGADLTTGTGLKNHLNTMELLYVPL